MEEGQISRSQSILEPVFYKPKSISINEIMQKIEECADGRANWVVGSGGETMTKIISRMYSRGHSGPLWEYLIR